MQHGVFEEDEGGADAEDAFLIFLSSFSLVFSFPLFFFFFFLSLIELILDSPLPASLRCTLLLLVVCTKDTYPHARLDSEK